MDTSELKTSSNLLVKKEEHTKTFYANKVSTSYVSTPINIPLSYLVPTT